MGRIHAIGQQISNADKSKWGYTMSWRPDESGPLARITQFSEIYRVSF